MNFEDLFRQDAHGTGAAEASKPDAGHEALSGATAMFGTLPAAQASAPIEDPRQRSAPLAGPRQDEPRDPLSGVPPQPSQTPPEVTQTPAALAAQGGFTQLLRALHTEPSGKQPAVATQSAAAMQPAAVPRPVVSPVQALEAPRPMTQWLPAIYSPDAPSPDALSPDAPSPDAVSPEKAAFPSEQKEAPREAPAQVTSFHRPMQQAPPTMSGAVPSTSFTQVFESLAGDKKEAAATPDAGTAPSFTQIFATSGREEAKIPLKIVSPSLEAAVIQAPSVVTKSRELPNSDPTGAASLAEEASSFTQMLQMHPAPSALSTEPVAPAIVPPSSCEAPSSSFTQMLRTLRITPDEPRDAISGIAKPVSEPGSFTQLVSTISPASTPEPPPLSARQAARPREQGKIDHPVPSEFAPHLSAGASAGSGPPFASVPQTPASSNLTQLLRQLDQPVAPVALPQFNASPTVKSVEPSGFTAVYRDLPGAAPAASHPATPQPMQTDAASAGPSDFTKLVNASALREGILKAGTAVPPNAAAPPMPVATPAHGPVLPSFAAPPALHVDPPEMPKVAVPAAPGSLQQYVPLLLIVVIFLLLAILVAVVLLMKK